MEAGHAWVAGVMTGRGRTDLMLADHMMADHMIADHTGAVPNSGRSHDSGSRVGRPRHTPPCPRHNACSAALFCCGVAYACMRLCQAQFGV